MVQIERLTQDAVYALLAAYGRQRDGAILQALDRLFLVHENVVSITWRFAGEGESGVRRESQPLQHIAKAIQLEGLASEIKETRREHGQLCLCFRSAGENGWSMSIEAGARADGQRPMRFTIVVEGPLRPATQERIKAFEHYLTGHRALYWAVHSLKSAPQAGRWQARLVALIADDLKPFSERISEASQLVDEMSKASSNEEAERTVEDAARWAVQEHLGTGWGVKRLAGKQSAVTRLEFCRCLHAYAANARVESAATAHCDPSPSRFQQSLGCYADILGDVDTQALQQRHATPAALGSELPGSLPPALWLLRDWTWIHELARARTASSESHPPLRATDSAALWDELARSLSGVLKEYLTDTSSCLRGETEEPGGNTAQIRSWLRLWFCHDLMRRWDELTEQLTPRERWRLRASIAYVVRESLRFDHLGKQRNYRFQPVALASELRTLVTLHAHMVLDVPKSLDVNLHLRAIGEPRDAHDYHVATGHLQHVLEVYIAGLFIGSIEVQGTTAFAGWKLAEVMANRGGQKPGPDLVSEFQRTYAVAALFHDVGVLLAWETRALRVDLHRGNVELVKLFGRPPGHREELGRQLVAGCREQLGDALLGLQSERAVRAWMEQQTERGAADHGLLGATYLHQLYRAGTDLQATEVIQQACRAILLHAAGACPVDAHCDAAAALLVVCDEIFEWGPSTRTLPTANAVSRLPQALAVNVEPHLSRAERLSFHGLNVENAADRLAVRMYVDGPYWPRIEMHLCHPEFLDIPVYRTWLSLAQNLGRLTPMKADGWHPLLVVHSKVPEDSHTTLQLLSEISERTSLPLRASLENWLRELAAWNRSGNEANDAETAYFAGSDQPFDGSFHLDELARVIEGGLRGSFRPEE